jgi:hypothetical protein
MTRPTQRQFVPVLVPKSEPAIQWRYCDRIEPGEYKARSRSAKLYQDGYFQRWVCAVQFDILNDSLIDVIARLTWYLNLSSKDGPRVGRRGKYWNAWIMANGGPPKRSDRLSPQVFVGRYAVVLVDDTQRDFEQVTNPQNAYSVVREVLKWQTGGCNR